MRALAISWLPRAVSGRDRPVAMQAAGHDGAGETQAPGRGAETVPSPGARGSAWMAVAALVVGVVATPFGVDLGGAGFGRLAEGVLEVREDDGWAVLEPTEVVPAGADVRTAGRPARIEVEGGLFTLAADSELETDAGRPRLRQGSLLVEAEDGPLRARVGATTAEGRGQWRIDVGVATRVATYRARLTLEDGVAERELGRFRQVDVRDGSLEPGARPLRYREDDPWDQWLLADALAVDRLADRIERSLARRYGEDPRQPAFYDAFAAVDAGVGDELEELAVTVEGDAVGPPGALLVGVVAVDALRAEAGLDVDEALSRVVSLRRAGARWGLVLVEHDLGAGALRAAVDRALEQVADEPPPPPPEDTAVDPATEPTGPAPAPEPGDGEADPTSPSDPEGDAPGVGDGDGGGTGPLDPALEPAEDTVRETGEQLGDVVGDTGEELGDAVGDSTDSVGGVVDDTGDAVGDVVGDVSGEVGGLLEDTTDTVGDLLGGARSQPDDSPDEDAPGEGAPDEEDEDAGLGQILAP